VEPPPQLTQAQPAVSPEPPARESTAKPIDSDRVSELERQKSQLEVKLVNMKQELATAESERQSLSKELAAAKEKLATLTTQTANGSTQASPVIAQQNR
jgi:peptidoglycan hydrolase CwlO-like protein